MIEVDRFGRDEWFSLVTEFRDANLYQFWNADGGVSRLAVRRNGVWVAAAEVRLVSLPFLRGGVAYVFWGPLWRRRNAADDLTDFREAISALVQEYVHRRGMILLVNGRLVSGQDDQCVEIMRSEGLGVTPGRQVKRTLILDVSCSLEEIRRNLDKKWRNCLSKAERSGLTIEAGTGQDLFDAVLPLHDAMLSRKKLKPESDIHKYRRAQVELPEPLKMVTVLASLEGKPCAGAIYSSAGDTGVYLFGAASDVGLRTSASYLVHWNVIQHLQQRGVAYYDLNGINPDLNPGTYHFKRGLAGRITAEVTMLGQYEASLPTAANRCVKLAQRVREAIHRAGARNT